MHEAQRGRETDTLEVVSAGEVPCCSMIVQAFVVLLVTVTLAGRAESEIAFVPSWLVLACTVHVV